MAYQSILNLYRSQPVACNLHHFVSPSEEPEVAILITDCIVPWIVDSWKTCPVHLTVAFRVLVESHEHSRPRLPDDQEPLPSRRKRFAPVINDIGLDAWKRECC